MAMTMREIVLCTALVFVIGVSVLNQALNSSISSSRGEETLLSPSASAHFHKQQKQQEHDRQLRLNQLQVIGTHNSYHREVSLAERAIFPSLMAPVDPRAEDYYYSHASVHSQLEHQQVRSFEFDLYADTHGGLFAQPLIRRLANMSDADKQHYALPASVMQQPGTKVLHIADADVGSICHTLVECLTQVKAWSQARRAQHVPIPILLEFKKTEPGIERQGGVRAEDWTVEALDRVDAEIRSVFADDQLITPDDIRKQAQANTNNNNNKNITLEDAILSPHGGWPPLSSSRGKFFFVMDNEATHPIQIRDPYRSNGRPNLEGRVIFTNSVPGQPDAAFIKRNDPRENNDNNNEPSIQELVARGYFVRTRADEPIQTVLHSHDDDDDDDDDNNDNDHKKNNNNNNDMRNAALASGAHIVSTDWAAPGVSARYNSDYFVGLPGRGPARCNPVNAPVGCDEEYLEI